MRQTSRMTFKWWSVVRWQNCTRSVKGREWERATAGRLEYEVCARVNTQREEERIHIRHKEQRMGDVHSCECGAKMSEWEKVYTITDETACVRGDVDTSLLHTRRKGKRVAQYFLDSVCLSLFMNDKIKASIVSFRENMCIAWFDRRWLLWHSIHEEEYDSNSCREHNSRQCNHLNTRLEEVIRFTLLRWRVSPRSWHGDGCFSDLNIRWIGRHVSDGVDDALFEAFNSFTYGNIIHIIFDTLIHVSVVFRRPLDGQVEDISSISIRDTVPLVNDISDRIRRCSSSTTEATEHKRQEPEQQQHIYPHVAIKMKWILCAISTLLIHSFWKF